MPSNQSQPRRGFPLVSLFGLVAVCAVLTALATLPLRSGIEIWDGNDGDGYWQPYSMFYNQGPNITNIVILCVVVTLFSILCGVVVGMHSHRRRAGCIIGISTGLVMGLLIAWLSLLSSDSLPHIAGLSVGSAFAMIVLGTIFYGMNRKK